MNLHGVQVEKSLDARSAIAHVERVDKEVIFVLGDGQLVHMGADQATTLMRGTNLRSTGTWRYYIPWTGCAFDDPKVHAALWNLTLSQGRKDRGVQICCC
jgi:cell division FtsZ-interacting protein ZapD